jgi:hypothetical protein
VPRGKDEIIENEFNQLLEAAANIAHQERVHTIGTTRLSLGHTLDALLGCVLLIVNDCVVCRMQQRRVHMRRMEHVMTIESAYDRVIHILAQVCHH